LPVCDRSNAKENKQIYPCWSIKTDVTDGAEACMKKIAILQSNYIPWKGYFDIINSVDEFVIYDEVQYTRRDWRNRNIIRTKNGLRWLTIPVKVKGNYNQKICETKIADKHWPEKHWETIRHNYKSSPYFAEYQEIFEKTFRKCNKLEFLSGINRLFIDTIDSILKIGTVISESGKYQVEGNSNERIISICKQAGADVYLTGPAARDYIDEEMFAKESVALSWVDYSGYPEYDQGYSGFENRVSIIDLIFHTGEKAPHYMKSF
jgi:hypothetical protein